MKRMESTPRMTRSKGKLTHNESIQSNPDIKIECEYGVESLVTGSEIKIEPRIIGQSEATSGVKLEIGQMSLLPSSQSPIVLTDWKLGGNVQAVVLLERHTIHQSTRSINTPETKRKQSKKSTRRRSNASKIHRCDICGKICKNLTRLKLHALVHSKVRTLQCPLCPKMFKCKSAVNTHSKSHTGEKPHLCKICGKGFRGFGNLKEHLSVHTGKDKSSRIPCSMCPKDFALYRYLVNHMRSHTGERPYICSFCNKGFYRNTTMMDHVRSHTGEKPYECNKCTFKTSRKFCLDSHLKTHEEDWIHNKGQKRQKTFVCKICAKGFVIKGGLTQHLQIHVDNKPYPCPVCGKSFRQKTVVWHHMKIHSNDKPFPCNLCGKKFLRNSTLICHIRIHTREKPYECKSCQKRFSDSKTYRKHQVKCAM